LYQIKDYCELLETTAFADLQNGSEALHYAQKAVAMTHEKDISALDLLARAHAMRSDWANAVVNARKALDLLPPADPNREIPELRKTLEANLALWSKAQTGAGASQAHR
jgi:cytochrome c-type biogenesis protein CcmH/NrfG